MSSLARVTWIAASALANFALWMGVGGGAQVGIAFFYAVPIALALLVLRPKPAPD